MKTQMRESSQPTEGISVQELVGLLPSLLVIPGIWLAVVVLVAILSMFEVNVNSEGENVITFRITGITAAVIALAWLPVILKIIALTGVSGKASGVELSTTGLLAQVELSGPEELGKTSTEQLRESPEKVIDELLKGRAELPPGLAEIFIGTETVVRQSGFVVSDNGYLISMGFEENQEVLVRLLGGTMLLQAKVIASSPDTLLSLLKLPDGTYPALNLTSSFDLGQRVFVVSIITAIAEGVIIGRDAMVRLTMPDGRDKMISGLITVEGVPSRAGSGGSPVLNEQGEVVGVRIAGTSIPPQILAVESRRMLSEFPQIPSSLWDIDDREGHIRSH